MFITISITSIIIIISSISSSSSSSTVIISTVLIINGRASREPLRAAGDERTAPFIPARLSIVSEAPIPKRSFGDKTFLYVMYIYIYIHIYIYMHT